MAEVASEVAAVQEKKTCRRGGDAAESSSAYCHLHRNPIPSKDNPPPGFCQWLHTFQVTFVVVDIIFHTNMTLIELTGSKLLD